jgi:hypothetical protein
MPHNKSRFFVLATVLLLLLFSLTACRSEGDVGDNMELSEQFMAHVMENDYDAAFAMVKATVSDEDFRTYWEGIRAAVDGSKTYEMESIGRTVTTARGITTRVTEFEIKTDTGRTIYLKTVTRTDYEGIAGIQFIDVTETVESSASYLPTVTVILYILSGISICFVALTFVDCLRRKMKYKVVWLLIILFSMGMAVSWGGNAGVSFSMGLFFEPSTIGAVLSRNAVVMVLNIPVGAFSYLCLRKKLFAPEEQREDHPACEPSEEAPTEE